MPSSSAAARSTVYEYYYVVHDVAFDEFLQQSDLFVEILFLHGRVECQGSSKGEGVVEFILIHEKNVVVALLAIPIDTFLAFRLFGRSRLGLGGSRLFRIAFLDKVRENVSAAYQEEAKVMDMVDR